MRTSALFGTKNVGFFEIDSVPVRTRTFFGKGGGGQFFAILCGSPLWTAPKVNHSVTCSAIIRALLA